METVPTLKSHESSEQQGKKTVKKSLERCFCDRISEEMDTKAGGKSVTAGGSSDSDNADFLPLKGCSGSANTHH